MKKAQQEDLIISEILENIDKIKIVDIPKYDAIGNIYALNSFLIYKKKTEDHKFICFLIWLVSFCLGFITISSGKFTCFFIFNFIGIAPLGYYFLHIHNSFIYSLDSDKKKFLRKNQKQIKSIVMQVETKNILNSIKN